MTGRTSKQVAWPTSQAHSSLIMSTRASAASAITAGRGWTVQQQFAILTVSMENASTRTCVSVILVGRVLSAKLEYVRSASSESVQRQNNANVSMATLGTHATFL